MYQKRADYLTIMRNIIERLHSQLALFWIQNSIKKADWLAAYQKILTCNIFKRKTLWLPAYSFTPENITVSGRSIISHTLSSKKHKSKYICVNLQKVHLTGGGMNWGWSGGAWWWWWWRTGGLVRGARLCCCCAPAGEASAPPPPPPQRPPMLLKKPSLLGRPSALDGRLPFLSLAQPSLSLPGRKFILKFDLCKTKKNRKDPTFALSLFPLWRQQQGGQSWSWPSGTRRHLSAPCICNRCAKKNWQQIEYLLRGGNTM